MANLKVFFRQKADNQMHRQTDLSMQGHIKFPPQGSLGLDCLVKGSPNMTLGKEPFENTVINEKTLITSIFSFSPNIFYPSQINFFFISMSQHYCCLQILSIWTSRKFGSLIKG